MNSPLKLVLCSALLLACPCLLAQAGDVTATFTAAHAGKAPKHSTLNNIVLWLTPIDESEPLRAVSPPKDGYRLTQKNKEFLPHLLVVPAGSSVDFPNFDPFFHNVFSLFNGKRFDLGLYDAGQHRSVRFDREGVSYIFCNIHPEMGAIVLALKTPYYAVSSATGAVTIHGVPPGQYRLHMWSEQYQGTNPTAAGRSRPPRHSGLERRRVARNYRAGACARSANQPQEQIRRRLPRNSRRDILSLLRPHTSHRSQSKFPVGVWRNPCTHVRFSPEKRYRTTFSASRQQEICFSTTAVQSTTLWRSVRHSMSGASGPHNGPLMPVKC